MGRPVESTLWPRSGLKVTLGNRLTRCGTDRSSRSIAVSAALGDKHAYLYPIKSRGYHFVQVLADEIARHRMWWDMARARDARPSPISPRRAVAVLGGGQSRRPAKEHPSAQWPGSHIIRQFPSWHRPPHRRDLALLDVDRPASPTHPRQAQRFAFFLPPSHIVSPLSHRSPPTCFPSPTAPWWLLLRARARCCPPGRRARRR